MYLLDLRLKIVTDYTAFKQTMQKEEDLRKFGDKFKYYFKTNVQMKQIEGLSRYPVIKQENISAKTIKAQNYDIAIQQIII